jgi:hypothetical protein
LVSGVIAPLGLWSFIMNQLPGGSIFVTAAVDGSVMATPVGTTPGGTGTLVTSLADDDDVESDADAVLDEPSAEHGGGPAIQPFKAPNATVTKPPTTPSWVLFIITLRNMFIPRYTLILEQVT